MEMQDYEFPGASAYHLGRGQLLVAHLLAALDEAQCDGHVLPDRVEREATRVRAWHEQPSEAVIGQWLSVLAESPQADEPPDPGARPGVPAPPLSDRAAS